jgi:hypothetical protein
VFFFGGEVFWMSIFIHVWRMHGVFWLMCSSSIMRGGDYLD